MLDQDPVRELPAGTWPLPSTLLCDKEQKVQTKNTSLTQTRLIKHFVAMTFLPYATTVNTFIEMRFPMAPEHAFWSVR